jgi:hypothetical protein
MKLLRKKKKIHLISNCLIHLIKFQMLNFEFNLLLGELGIR